MLFSKKHMDGYAYSMSPEAAACTGVYCCVHKENVLLPPINHHCENSHDTDSVQFLLYLL